MCAAPQRLSHREDAALAASSPSQAMTWRKVVYSSVGAELVIQVMRFGEYSWIGPPSDRGVGCEAGRVTPGVEAVAAARRGSVFGQTGGC